MSESGLPPALGPRKVLGVVLAAGAGRRFGHPKALVPGWVEDRCAALSHGGCDAVVVVLGAAAGDAEHLVPAEAETVVAPDWAAGMSASLSAGLARADELGADAVVIALVDTPGLTAGAVARVLAAAQDGAASGRVPAGALVQATYDGAPGHPVVLGRAHWRTLRAEVRGDRGARDYLDGHGARLVPCDDIADGRDIDRPASSEPPAPPR